MIADRNRRVREFLGRELAAEGYDIRMAKDGREVMAAIVEDDPPDLVILDLNAPNIGCPALCEWLGHHSSPPFIIHTFTEEPGDPAWAEHAAAIVEKSENPEALKSAVAEVLGRIYATRFSLTRKGGAPKSRGGSTGGGE